MNTIDASAVIEKLGSPYFRELSTFGALSDDMIADILHRGHINQLQRGEYLARFDQPADSFQVILSGRLAYYKHCGDHDVLTRYFEKGEQMGFDLMIGLIRHNGTDVAVEDTLLLDISDRLFYQLHVDHPEEFGLLMINLARELSREISLLEDVVGRSTGWLVDQPG
jgi:signal-transduction protein with cAMP-binding, CBS, and nucleotidyltransferase domain